MLNRVKVPGDPTDPQDAVTKAYVDTLKMILYRALDLADLVAAGAHTSDLLASGYSVSELLDAGVSVLDLYESGVLVGTLEQNGAVPDSLEAAGLIGSITDIDGNIYKWVKIGDQIWMAENLKVTHYNDGTPIPLVEDSTAWDTLWNGDIKAYCWYDNSTLKGDIYGALYTWESAFGACPEGWHPPSGDEWEQLYNTLGGWSIAGGKLKETGTIHWASPNEGATNESGFTALPGGYRQCRQYNPHHSGGAFFGIGDFGIWWSTDDGGIKYYWAGGFGLYYNESSMGGMPEGGDKTQGFSVRCLKD